MCCCQCSRKVSQQNAKMLRTFREWRVWHTVWPIWPKSWSAWVRPRWSTWSGEVGVGYKASSVNKIPSSFVGTVWFRRSLFIDIGNTKVIEWIKMAEHSWLGFIFWAPLLKHLGGPVVWQKPWRILGHVFFWKFGRQLKDLLFLCEDQEKKDNPPWIPWSQHPGASKMAVF